MSLFSIVQGRVPPPMPAVPPMTAPAPAAPVPPMPQAAPAPMPQMNMPAPAPMTAPPAAAPPMAAPPVPGSAMGGMVTGYADGGQLGFEYEYAPYNMAGNADTATNRYMTDGVMGIPGYETGGNYGGMNLQANLPSPGYSDSPTNPLGNGNGGSGDYTPVNDPGSLLAAAKTLGGLDPVTGKPLTLQQVDQYVTWFNNQQKQDRQNSIADANAARGPDHFYQQQAEAAREFNATLAQKQQDSADQRTLANYNAAAARSQADTDYRLKQQQAMQAKQNNVTQAASQAQNAFLEALKQASPNQGHPVFFTPTAIYEDAKQNNTLAPTQDYQPNLPGAVY